MNSIKKITILAILLIMMFTLGGCKQEEPRETGTFNEINLGIGNYEVLIQAQNAGHPSDGYHFVTDYRKEYKREDYEMDFGVFLSFKAYNEQVQNNLEYESMEDIKLLGNNFKYSILSDENILLVYKYDDEFYLTIDVKEQTFYYNDDGNEIKDDNGNYKKMEEYNLLEILKNDEEFNKSVSFEIRKK